MNREDLEPLFHPRSIALVGITTNPKHWTRTFLDALLEFQFEGPLYLVNPRGGEIRGLKVYRRLEDIPDVIDYVISTVPASVAPELVEACAARGVRAIHFCTAGFSETGEERGLRLEAELAEISRRAGVRIIGPNCMGIYCPRSRLSFDGGFPREAGPVAFIGQSGGNTIYLVRQAAQRGVRFSKVISFGNACDLDESDFLEYLTSDPDSRILALYVEGVKDGRRFRQTLEEAARKKVVILLKGGVTEGGVRAVASHTGALAGNEVAWDALCKQSGVLRVHSLEEMVDVLVTASFLPLPRGRNVALVGHGGGASVLITDEFERNGLRVPLLPQEVREQLLEFTPATGNILRNPIDYSQTFTEPGKLARAVEIISRWEGIDLIIGFLILGQTPWSTRGRVIQLGDELLKAKELISKPMAMVLEPSILPEEVRDIFSLIERFVSAQVPVYYSFARAARAISLVLSHQERTADLLARLPH